MKEDNIGFICIPRTTDDNDKIYQKYNKCHPKCKGSTFNICITKKTGLQSVFLLLFINGCNDSSHHSTRTEP